MVQRAVAMQAGRTASNNGVEEKIWLVTTPTHRAKCSRDEWGTRMMF
jgi:hypothetical protein